jgi:D-alanine transaminase
MSESIVYLNGVFLPLRDARVPVLDRGFIFGDGVYEVLPSYAGRLFRLEQHLARLERSLAEVRINNPFSREAWAELLLAVVQRNPWPDQSIYLQVTRGVAERIHNFPERTTPTVFIMPSELKPPAPELRTVGVTAATLEDFRWLRCDIKSTSLLGNCLLKQVAADRGAYEAVLIRDGFLTEGSSSNIFVVKNGVVATTPRNHLILAGITYDALLELSGRGELRIEQRGIPAAELRSADELWLSSSTREVLPITRLDDTPVGDGRVGPMYRRVDTAYQALKRAL